VVCVSQKHSCSKRLKNSYKSTLTYIIKNRISAVLFLPFSVYYMYGGLRVYTEGRVREVGRPVAAVRVRL